jgi:Protein of unknown function (DUF2848)
MVEHMPEEPSMLFTVSDASGARDLACNISRAVIAGWTGRDPLSVEKHIRELEAVGVPRPSSTPIFYFVATNRLVTSPVIEVSGDRSSGEVEFILVQSGSRLYVGVGSDHTDRAAETYSVTVSKQMCDKPLAAELWDFADVTGHWDELVLRSWASVDQRRVLYQEGSVSHIRTPADLIDRYAGTNGLPEGTVMFCGTLAAQGGIRSAQRFEFELEDPVRGRRIRHGYDIVALPIAL